MYKVVEYVWVIIAHTAMILVAWYNVRIAVIVVIALSALVYGVKEISAIMQKRALKKAERVIMQHEAMKRYKSGLGTAIQ